MTLEHKDIMPEVNDWLGAWFFRTVEDLAANNCQYLPERDLARAELHGGRLEKVITPVLGSINSLVRDAQVADQVNNQILPELRNLDIQSAKNRVLQQIDSMPSSKIRERVPHVISYIYRLKATGASIDPGDEAFLHLNIEEQEALTRAVMKLVVEIYFPQLRRLFLVALNWLRKGKFSVEKYPLLPEACRFIPWRMTLEVVPLADDPKLTKNLLCSENKAIVQDREAFCGWSGDTNEAFKVLDSALRVELQLRLKMKGWHIPGARYRGTDNWEKPSNDEPQLVQIGELNGLEWARKQSLLELLVKGASGELRNTFIKIADHILLGEIRKENRRRGINVPPDWSYAGKTEDEIRKRVDKDIIALAAREVLDYDLETEDSSISTLEQASDKQAFKEWREVEVETQRKALIVERVAKLSLSVKLSPRLRLVAKLYDKPDEIIATRLERKFGKPFTKGAVRALRHDLLQKLREAAPEK
jgi:hypothetical protein